MAKKNQIILQVGIQQLGDEKLITETLASEIKGYSEHIGIDIAFDYGALPDPLWDSSVYAFELFKDVPNIINIRELYVPKDLRKQGYATTILNIITTVMSKNSLIFAEASISTKEYPPIKYSLKENDDGKEVLDVEKLLTDAMEFIAGTGFYNVDPFMEHNNDMSRLMLFQNALGRIAYDYMRAYIVTANGLASKAIKRIYRDVFYILLQTYEDDDVHPIPYVLEDKICPKLGADVDVEALKDEPWFSDYKGDKSNNIAADVALKNRLILSDIGGQEVRVGSKDVSALIGPFSLYIDNSVLDYRNTTDVLEEDGQGGTSTIEDKYRITDTAVFKIVGYVLMIDGIWYECDGYYDCEEGLLYLTDYNADDAMAYVGNFSCTHESE